MQTMELVERPEAAERTEPGQGELDRRIENIMRVKALSGKLRPARERHFSEMMQFAQERAASSNAANRTVASSTLDVLALELCDE